MDYYLFPPAVILPAKSAPKITAPLYFSFLIYLLILLNMLHPSEE